MALKRDTRYPGRFVAANTAHPQGAFKNRSTPTSQDGSYLEADWMNDIDGFFARILNVAGVTPNGTVDDGTTSQLYNALLTAMPGRMIGAPRVITTTSSYTPTSGTNKIVIECVGAGGGGGGVVSGTAGGHTVSGGGGAGGRAMHFVNGISGTFSVTIGIAGAGGAAGVTGTTGGTTSFLQNGTVICSASGGAGGGAGTLSVSQANTVVASGGPAGAGITGNISLGGYESASIATAAFGSNIGSSGGSSAYGNGGARVGQSTQGSQAGNNATGRGAGGGGAVSVGGTSSGEGGAQAGGSGTGGVVIIWEYS